MPRPYGNFRRSNLDSRIGQDYLSEIATPRFAGFAKPERDVMQNGDVGADPCVCPKKAILFGGVLAPVLARTLPPVSAFRLCEEETKAPTKQSRD